MKRIGTATAIVTLLLASPAFAKDPETQFKTVEAKHFARSEGVELSAEFSDYLYAELRAELTKSKLCSQVIGEGELVDAADAPASLIVEGTLIEYKKGSVVKSRLIGFGSGLRSLRIEASVNRRSDNKSLAAIKVKVKTLPQWDEKVLAKEAAKQIVKEMKKSLKVGASS